MIKSCRSFLLFAVLVAAPLAAHAQATDVTITNPVYAPGQVIIPADALPVVETQYLVAGDGQTTALGEYELVPAGYRLIIDFVSISETTPFGQRAYAIVKPCDNIKGAPWGVVPIQTTVMTDVDGQNVNLGQTAMHLYADPGCRPRVLAVRNGKTGNFGGHATLQGHYARIPVTSR